MPWISNSTRLIATLSCLALCSAWPLQAAPQAKVAQGKEAAHEHEHAHMGPHKGHLIELGEEEFHAEILHDDKAGSVTIYVLDSEAKAAVGTSAKEATIAVNVGGKPAAFKLKAMPQKSDKSGMTSRFATVDKGLIKALDTEGAKPQLKIAIGEKRFTGKTPHAHDHDHAPKGKSRPPKN